MRFVRQTLQTSTNAKTMQLNVAEALARTLMVHTIARACLDTAALRQDQAAKVCLLSAFYF